MTYHKNMEKYLITGAAGQLGFELSQQWGGEEGHALPRAREAFDISDWKQVSEWLPRMRPDAVVNCAAYTNVVKAEEDREDCWMANVLGVEHLCKICSRDGIPLIQLSTDFVFGQDRRRRLMFTRLDVTKLHPEDYADLREELLYKETDPPGPLNQYGHSKNAAEAVIFRYAAQNPDFQWYIVRTAGLFEKPWRYSTNFPFQVVRALQNVGVTEIPVVENVFTNITYVPHLAEAVRWLVENRDAITVESGPLAPTGIYHITNGGEVRWYEVATRIAYKFGRTDKLMPLPHDEYAKRRGINPRISPNFTCLSGTKYNETLGPIMPSWQSALDNWISTAKKFFKRSGKSRVYTAD